MRDQIWILDTETTTLSTSDTPANPFDPLNSIVMLGLYIIERKDLDNINPVPLLVNVFLRTPLKYYAYDNCKYYVNYKNQAHVVAQGFDSDTSKNMEQFEMELNFSRCHTIVGHNISFDILHMLRDVPTTPATEDLKDIRIWDTMLGTYLLSGQTKILPSMDKSLQYFGINATKAEGPKAMWDAGYQTTDIPFATLSNYLREDVVNTAKLFLKQFRGAMLKNKLRFFMDQMESLFAHTMITKEGMVVDKGLLNTKIDAGITDLADINRVFIDSIAKLVDNAANKEGLTSGDWEIEKIKDFITSRKKLSDLFYKQIVTVKIRITVGLYKNGNNKTITQYRDLTVPLHKGTHGPLADMLKVTPDANDIYPLSEKEIKALLYQTKSFSISIEGRSLLNLILLFRKQSKILKTYLTPVYQNIFPSVNTREPLPHMVWKIHPNFNMAVTATGRLSSSKPNFHNQIDDPYKEIFYAPEGYKMVEIDFNQLEIMVLGIVSGDKNLCNLLRAGTDVHSYLFKQIHGVAPTKEQRKVFKACSFGLIYGSSAAGLVESTGMPHQDVLNFMDTWFANFPDSQKYADTIKDHIDMNNVSEPRPGSVPIHKGTFELPHGRTLTFAEYDNPKFPLQARRSSRAPKYSWRMPALKNYPIQALASDIVKYVITKIIRKQMIDPELSKIKVVNTVHDNGVFYVPEENFGDHIQTLKDLMTDVGPWLKARGYQTYGLEFKVEESIGTNWYNCK